MSNEVAFARVNRTDIQFFTANGTMLKAVTSPGAVSAQPTGDGVAVTMKNGSVKLYDRNGSLIKTIG